MTKPLTPSFSIRGLLRCEVSLDANAIYQFKLRQGYGNVNVCYGLRGKEVAQRHSCCISSTQMTKLSRKCCSAWWEAVDAARKGSDVLTRSSVVNQHVRFLDLQSPQVKSSKLQETSQHAPGVVHNRPRLNAGEDRQPCKGLVCFCGSG